MSRQVSRQPTDEQLSVIAATAESLGEAFKVLSSDGKTDYIVTARKKEFYKFRELMQSDKDQGEALKEAFGVSGYKDFNDKWKEWVLKNY